MLKKHWQYAKYIARHKWFVFIECCKQGIPIQGILHDMSKFLPSEWFPYLNFFYGKKDKNNSVGYSRYNDPDVDPVFDRAWLKHIHRNPHHWQNWVLREDSGDVKCLEMPTNYAIEMVCDWKGAGIAQGHGKPGELREWYKENRSNMQLHPKTKHFVEWLVGNI